MDGAADLLSAAEAATLAGTSERTIQRWAASKKLPAVKMPGATGAYLFARADVEALIGRQEPPDA